MSIVSGYNKYKRYILTNSGYKLVSQWTNANTVEMDDGSTLQSTIASLNSTLTNKVNKSGDIMSGGLTFNKVTNAINYTGTKSTYPMIKFKDNTGDEYGNGIVIGGGGSVIIGGGESADNIASTFESGGDEVLKLCNDGAIDFYTNVQGGASSASHTWIDTSGIYQGRSKSLADTGNNNDITACYSRSGMSSASWLCAWDNYQIAPISPANITAGNSTKWNGKTDDSGTLNTTDTWIPVYASGKMQHALREIWSNAQHCDYNNTNKRSYLATMSCLTFWNGAYNGNGNSNLQYCDRGRFGTIVTKSSGDVVGTYSNGTYYNVSNLITFKDTNNALTGGGKGNYIFGISAWSDKRLKTNIKDSEVNALDLINKIQMREFDFIDEKFGKHKDIGYVAQELMEIIPECVEEVPLPDEDKEEYDVESMYQVEDKHIIPYLVKAIQELADIIKEQQKEIEELKVLIN